MTSTWMRSLLDGSDAAAARSRRDHLEPLIQWRDASINENPSEEFLILWLYRAHYAQITMVGATVANFNFENSQFVGNLGVNSQFNETIAEQVASLNVSTELTPELADAFKAAWEQLRQLPLDQADKNDVVHDLKRLQEEASKQAPDKSRLKRYWDRCSESLIKVGQAATAFTALGKLIEMLC